MQTDPQEDMRRIEDSKGLLLDGSCDWIFEDAAFRSWWDVPTSRLLWISGDPGKGKTMLAIAVIAEMRKRLQSQSGAGMLSFFFFQSTIPTLNSAVSALRGVIYLLVTQRPEVIRHLRKRYDDAGENMFGGHNAMVTLWAVLSDIIKDDIVPKVYIVLDALDECSESQEKLLSWIVGSEPGLSSKVKWLLTSRNEPIIKERLQRNDVCSNTSLEVNSARVKQAVGKYIASKVAGLARDKRYHEDLRHEVETSLIDKAEGTFLWVAPMCEELRRVRVTKNTMHTLRKLPASLQSLYERMMQLIDRIEEEEDNSDCTGILCFMTAAFRPVSVTEIGHLAKVSENLANDPQSVEQLIDLCGSFLLIRDDYIYFVHQSAKDYFTSGSGKGLLTSGLTGEHRRIFQQSQMLISNTLCRDICGLGAPGTLIREATEHVRKLPGKILYPCLYWIEHALEILSAHKNDAETTRDIESFFKSHLLHWLEVISLMRKMSEAVAMIEVLNKSLAETCVSPLLQDTVRLILQNRGVVGIAPLQVYVSALAFSPTNSMVRVLYGTDYPRWVKFSRAIIGENTSFYRQKLLNNVSALAFSPDGKLLASAFFNGTIRFWDVATGAIRRELKDHSKRVSALTFSPDGKLLASVSWDGTIKLWDVGTGATRRKLEGHSQEVHAVALSPDGKLLACVSYDAIRLWSTETGTAVTTIDVRHHIHTLSFVANGLRSNLGFHPLPPRLAATNPSTSIVPTSLSITQDWVYHGQKRLLWLPDDYRPYSRAFYGNTVAVGSPYGCVVIMTIDEQAVYHEYFNEV